jgi:CO/xanthine dehydrogenase FAD-binding subunit
VDFPILSVALAVQLTEDETVESISLVVSALAARPREIGRLNEIARGQELTTRVIEEVASQAHRQCHPLPNLIVDTDWRRAMVPVHVRRAFAEILGCSAAA